MIQRCNAGLAVYRSTGRGRMARETGGETYPAPIVDQNNNPGAVTRLLILGIVLVGAAVAFVFFKDRLGEPFLLGMLGILAMIGVFYLFATVIGFVQLSPRSAGDELSKALVDSMGQGIVVTDSKGSCHLRKPCLCGYDRRFFIRGHKDCGSTAGRQCRGFGTDPQDRFIAARRNLLGRRIPSAKAIAAGIGKRRVLVPRPCQSLQSTEPGRTAFCLADCRHLVRAGRTGTVFSRICKRPSIIWITHRPVSSQPILAVA